MNQGKKPCIFWKQNTGHPYKKSWYYRCNEYGMRSTKVSDPESIPELIRSVAEFTIQIRKGIRSTLLSTYLIQSICLKESLSPGPFTSTNQISSFSGFHSVRSGNPDLTHRRMIRLIESNSKCRYLAQFICKRSLREVFICVRPPAIIGFCFWGGTAVL